MVSADVSVMLAKGITVTVVVIIALALLGLVH